MIGQQQDTIHANFRRKSYPFRRLLKAGSASYYDRAEVMEWIDAGARDKYGRYRVTPKAKM
jgi:hypothetical protein